MAGERERERKVKSERTSERPQSIDLLAKLCEIFVQHITGCDSVPVERRGLGGGLLEERGQYKPNMSAADEQPYHQMFSLLWESCRDL